MPHDADYGSVEETPSSQRLTNDDFRKLLMTPKVPSGSSHASGSIREAMANSGSASKSSMPPPSERHEARRKKKNFYAALKKQEDTKLQELADKYRDRARERRDGANPDYQAMDVSGNASSAYRAVAPDIKSGLDAAERRRQMIQESKFLGGDMEHTHLVKGLDYALLQKVRSEIVVKEHEQELEMEKLAEAAAEEKEKLEEEKELAEEPEYRSIMGRNIFNIVSFYRSRHVEKNELFAPGRMAYVIELDDDAVDSDIPTTLIRSKADVPVTEAEIQTLTTNDIVINKLAQILSYLRQGGRGKKNKKRDKDKPLLKEPIDRNERGGAVGTSGGGGGGGGINDDQRRDHRDNDRDNRNDRYDNRSQGERRRPAKDVSIYDDVDDYRPSRRGGGGGGGESGGSGNNNSSKGGESGDNSRKNRNYFDKSSEQEEREAGGLALPPPPKISTNLISKLTAEPEGYAECYPGLQEMNDAIDDSDDEVDYTKMDLGNKKGPIGRWDFDTQEEYSDYMSTKEALPKAAFQYGVKMQDGRKTRKHKTEKNEKAELDREWQKIQNIIQKRKTKGGGGGTGGGGGGGDGTRSGGGDEPDFKIPKH